MERIGMDAIVIRDGVKGERGGLREKRGRETRPER